jgi:internalin A
MTDTPEWALKKIQEAKEKRLKELDLSADWLTPANRKLTAIPSEVFELEQLEALDLSHNRLAIVPDSIIQLQNLALLNLSDNELKVVPDVIDQLHNLTSLDLSNNELIAVPNVLGQLRNLTSLDLSNNKLIAVPNALGQLQNLTLLNLNLNQLVALPEAIAQLQNLTIFLLAGNCFQFIPDSIYELHSLEILDFRAVRLPGIREISSKILQLEHLKELRLADNRIEIPPPEVIKNGVGAIKDYFRQLQAEGKDYLYEAKLLIVGEGGAGKTTLMKKIENPKYQLREDEGSTEGIDVTQWHFPMEDGKNFRVNIWDFGGQEIYHATHQFFLTKRSLYALVADTRKEDTNFYYWLNVVELLAENSPLLIVKNEKQDRHREINERQLRGQFENLKATLATNLDTNRGLPEVLNEIKHYVRQLPHIGSPLPKTWVKVREALEKDPRNHISLDKYLDICEQNGFKQLNDKLQLSGYLHDLGVCLHFQEDPLLKKTVILKPKWGTDAAYKVLDNKTVIRNLGRFTRADLASIWDQPEYINMQDELLRLMINFKLCYQLPASRDTYIAPQLLTENQPDYDWDEMNNLVLRYTYEFMPKGILTQFIVAMHSLIADQNRVWKSGVVLEEDRTRAEVVEHYGKREIKIRIAGNYKKDLVAIVTRELDRIHATYRRLKYSKLIPCNCRVCKDDQEPHFYFFKILLQFTEDRQEVIQCQKSYQMVNVWSLIDAVIDRGQIAREEEMKMGGVGF